MKPGVTPYDRNSRLGLKMITVNPCNDFIIQTLLRWKVKVEKEGLNQFYTYNLALEAVRKYPLPILCYEQMKVLEGFGKFFCTSVSKLVRAHYRRGRLPTKEEKDQIDKEHELYLRREMKKLKNMNKNGQKTGENQEENEQSDVQTEKYSEFNDNFESQVPDGDEDDASSIFDDNSDSRSEVSDASSMKSNKSYKPKPGTENFHILRAMYLCGQKHKDQPKISKGEINLMLYEWKMDKVRTWNKVIAQLKQTGYIKVDTEDDYNLYLTTKGKDFVQDNLDYDGPKNQTRMLILRKQLATNIKNIDKLSLLINTKGLFKPQEVISSFLTQNEKYQAKQAEFELGSFIWMLDTKILDYIAFRFKIENFDLQDFLTTCLRAKDSGCSNIYFIMQFPENSKQKLPISSETIEDLISKARATQFKIIRTKGTSGTIDILLKMIDKIKDKLRSMENGEQVWMMGDLGFYNEKNKKLLPIVLKEVTRKMLKCIPKMKRKAVETILQKLPTLRALYNQLVQMSQHSQRIELVNWWLKPCNTKPAVNMMLIDLLFSESYDLPEDQIV